MPRPVSHKWFRRWAPEMLGDPDPDGFNMLDVLAPQERWCWESLLAMCAVSEYHPAICHRPFMGLTDLEISTIMRVNQTVWKECKAKLVFAGKISVDSNNVIVINGWDRFASKYFRGHQYKDGYLQAMTIEEEMKLRAVDKEKHSLFAKVIKHLNDKTGKNYRVSGKASFGHFSARFDEGNRWEDFKHVIDVKCQRWLGDDDMEIYLRPETLFNSEKFESYRQERLVVRKRQAGEAPPPTIMPEERKKYEAHAKEQFEKLKAKIMAEHGVMSDDDWYALMLTGDGFTFEEFFNAYIKKLRKTSSWSLEDKESGDD